MLHRHSFDVVGSAGGPGSLVLKSVDDKQMVEEGLYDSVGAVDLLVVDLGNGYFVIFTWYFVHPFVPHMDS